MTSPDMKTPLKPCPFCGGEATALKGTHNFQDAIVMCAKCGAEGPMFDCDDGKLKQYERNLAAATDAWNHRALPPPEPVAGVSDDAGAMREAVEQLTTRLNHAVSELANAACSEDFDASACMDVVKAIEGDFDKLGKTPDWHLMVSWYDRLCVAMGVDNGDEIDIVRLIEKEGPPQRALPLAKPEARVEGGACLIPEEPSPSAGRDVWREHAGALRYRLRMVLDDLSSARGAGGDGNCHKLDTPSQVFFYEQDFYVLSNFSAFNLRWRGHTFPTSEHAYQHEKFCEDVADAARVHRAVIRNAPSAHEAFKHAELHKAARRPDWGDVKVKLMREILMAKAQQHEYVRRKLLQTGNRELIEDSWRDDYWGWGPNRDGQNMLGKLWMEIRAGMLAPPLAAVESGKGGGK